MTFHLLTEQQGSQTGWAGVESIDMFHLLTEQQGSQTIVPLQK